MCVSAVPEKQLVSHTLKIRIVDGLSADEEVVHDRGDSSSMMD
jgi:hypothetical protein